VCWAGLLAFRLRIEVRVLRLILGYEQLLWWFSSPRTFPFKQLVATQYNCNETTSLFYSVVLCGRTGLSKPFAFMLPLVQVELTGLKSPMRGAMMLRKAKTIILLHHSLIKRSIFSITLRLKLIKMYLIILPLDSLRAPLAPALICFALHLLTCYRSSVFIGDGGWPTPIPSVPSKPGGGCATMPLKWTPDSAVGGRRKMGNSWFTTP
jgi:hypothetical protein